MTDRHHAQPADWKERRRAVDITRSCIVQAPAGSGKTELLVQRILALLAVAQVPEEILAITFTRKAAGEMKMRLLKALERGRDEQPPLEAHARETWERARSVLSRDQALGWGLLQNPSRIQLMTIDSLCAFLTRRMPWLSRFGEPPAIADDALELYREAAEKLLMRLDDGGEGQEAIARLLEHLDNRMTLLRDLLVVMLGRRDQWLRHLMAQRTGSARQILESGLQSYVEAAFLKVHTLLGDEHYATLRELALYAAGRLAEDGGDNPLAVLLDVPEDQRCLDQWLALCHLVLTGAGGLRKSVSKTNGFPADKSPLPAAMKARMQQFLEVLGEREDLVAALRELRNLPRTSYAVEEWRILEALTELLPLAVIELQEVFRVRGLVDFTEVAGGAQAALGSIENPEELLLQLDSRIRHVLVDEFQDTSYTQYELLLRLTAGWEQADGRTLFLVGDPMQSIYRFREAEVGLYLRICRLGLSSLSMEKVVLTTNFRSCQNLVDWANDKFAGLFPAEDDDVLGAVSFSPATAFHPPSAEPAVSLHGFVDRQETAEAQTVVRLVQQARATDPDGTVAVLVRARTHLVEIIRAFKQAGLTFQAQDIDPLTSRPVVQDLLALTRALLHPADRVAWLAVLRAPWCGLTLADLLVLCQRGTRATVWELLTRPAEQQELFERLSHDGQQRLDLLLPVLEQGLRQKGRLPLRRLVATVWLGLNGPACYDSAAMDDAEQVFALLGKLDDKVSVEDLDRQLTMLYASPDATADAKLQILTIHKAKGLEFDTVILPGLGRGTARNERELLRWLEHPDFELLLAPIPPVTSSQQAPTYQAIGRILQEKDNLETLRLLYVAATRARHRLHLLGHARRDAEGRLSPTSGSLLAALWPTCAEEFDFIDPVHSEIEPAMKAPTLLRRLALDWRPPPLPGRLPLASVSALRASDAGHYLDKGIETRRTEEGRIIGTLVHLWLERIASEGLRTDTKEWLLRQSRLLAAQLGDMGVPYSRREACTSILLNCLINTIESERGKWLLWGHGLAANELEINGLVDGELVRASIDRTFVDDRGVRWVVDYKTSSPGSGEEPAHFLNREGERYRKQLDLYVRLLRQLEPQRQTSAALYFPMIDGWLEYPAESLPG